MMEEKKPKYVKHNDSLRCDKDMFRGMILKEIPDMSDKTNKSIYPQKIRNIKIDFWMEPPLEIIVNFELDVSSY